jgi:hypothetical protein
MRLFYVLAITTFLFSSCGSSDKKSSVDKQILFGSWEDNVYKNSFIDLKVDFDENWEFTKPSFQTRFGGSLFETTYLGSDNQDYPINIEVSLDKANPFETPSVKRKIKESLEGYGMLFDEEQMVKYKPSKNVIGGKDFLLNKLLLIEDSDTSFITEYYRYTAGYYLSIVCIYNTELDETAAMEFMSEIKSIK